LEVKRNPGNNLEIIHILFSIAEITLDYFREGLMLS